MSDIFICYARKDLKISEKIHQALAEFGIAVWVDWEDIPKAEDFLQKTFRSIENSSIFVYLLSPDSIESETCQEELDHAVTHGKRIIPIVIRDVKDIKNVPSEISNRNWIYCRDGNDIFDEAIEEIKRTINIDYEWLSFHTYLLQRALDWDKTRDEGESRLLRGSDLIEAEQRLVNIKNIVDPQPTKIQKEFVLASRRHADKQRRNLTISVISVTGIILSLIFTSWYLYTKSLLSSRGEQNSTNSELLFVVLVIIGVVFLVIGIVFYIYNSIVRRTFYDQTFAKEPVTAVRVFLCHASNDKSKVRQLYDRLKNEKGIDPWLDVEKLLPGVDWDLEITAAVKTSHVVLVCLSKDSINKEGYIQKEIKQALDVADEKPDGTIFIIPLRLEDCDVPVRLKKWQWLDLFEKDSYDKLLNSLRARAKDLVEKNTGVQ